MSSTSAITVNNIVIEVTTSTVNGDNNIIGMDPNLTTLSFLPSAKQRVHTFTNGSSQALDHVNNAIGDAQCGQSVIFDQMTTRRPL